MAHKGRFKPINPSKYKGNPTNIIYRSSWELRLMRFFDSNDSVIEWGSEEIIIPYISPADNKYHRYFPDFYVKIKSGDKTINKLIEVKPKKQVNEPVKDPKHPRRYLKEVMTYGINQRKWEAAQKFCKDRGWEFQIMTEADIY